jgi:hypothetical protein
MLLQTLTTPEAAESFVWFDKLSEKFFLRLGIDFIAVFILIRIVYFRHYKRTDLFLTFFIFNLIIFLLTYLLNKVELSMGAAFGLFAVFSMLRYRTEILSAKDMTYLFLVIAIALVSAITKGGWDEIGLLNFIVLIVTIFLESPRIMRKESTQMIVYNNLELIKPQNREALLADLKLQTGLEIKHIDIQKIDLPKNVAQITVYYFE